MGSTDGRLLIFTIHSLDSQNEQSLNVPASLPDVFSNLTGFRQPRNFDASFCDPIKDARVTKLVHSDSFSGTRPSPKRYDGSSKPVFVQADILLRHLNTGESTTASTEFRNLSEAIRNRGLGSPDDDCGHVVAKQYGGKIIDYNLFPQDMRINRGIGVWSRIWKWGIELIVRIWLISMAPWDPMVRFRIRLIYPGIDDTKPDRPVCLHYHIEFYRRERKESEETEDERRSNIEALRLFLKAAILGEIPNYCMEINAEQTKQSMRSFCDHLTKLREMAGPDFRKLLEVYVEEIENSLKPPQPTLKPTTPPMGANKPFSWWDIVPIVGSVRTLDDAVRCGQEGDTAGALINGTLGVAGLALDALSLGTIGMFGKAAGTAVKEGVKVVTTTAVKEGTKAVAKQGVQMAIKQVSLVALEKVFAIAVTEMAKESLVALTQTAVTQAARRAVEGIAANVS